MSKFNKKSRFEADMEDSVVSFSFSSLGNIESTYEENNCYWWKIRRQYIELTNQMSKHDIVPSHVEGFNRIRLKKNSQVS